MSGLLRSHSLIEKSSEPVATRRPSRLNSAQNTPLPCSGNSHNISPSLLSPATTISATIANEFTEATSNLYTSSLIALGLILFVITFLVLGFAKWMLARAEVK